MFYLFRVSFTVCVMCILCVLLTAYLICEKKIFLVQLSGLRISPAVFALNVYIFCVGDFSRHQ